MNTSCICQNIHYNNYRGIDVLADSRKYRRKYYDNKFHNIINVFNLKCIKKIHDIYFHLESIT